LKLLQKQRQGTELVPDIMKTVISIITTPYNLQTFIISKISM